VVFGRANMPIFQDDDDELAQNGVPTPERRTTTPPSSKTPSDSVSIRRKLSEESIRTELCEGPLPDSLEKPSTLPEESSNSCFAPPLHGTTDRLEYIERLKRGESPSWPQVGKVGEVVFIALFVPANLLSTTFSWTRGSTMVKQLLPNRSRIPTMRPLYCPPPNSPIPKALLRMKMHKRR
jgi:hypothetical protein